MSAFALKAKIHLACVTDANLDYDGSLEIEVDLMDAVGIKEYEQLHVYNNTNGNRYITYDVKGLVGSGCINAHGAGAHLVSPNNHIVIFNYQAISQGEFSQGFRPAIISLNEENIIQLKK